MRKLCGHCGKRRQVYSWKVWACASNGKKQEFFLCNQCDIKLNDLVLTFANDPDRVEKIAEYARRK